MNPWHLLLGSFWSFLVQFLTPLLAHLALQSSLSCSIYFSLGHPSWMKMVMMIPCLFLGGLQLICIVWTCNTCNMRLVKHIHIFSLLKLIPLMCLKILSTAGWYIRSLSICYVNHCWRDLSKVAILASWGNIEDFA